MSKKSRIITRSRYRHADISRQGKWELREWQEQKNQATSRIYLPKREREYPSYKANVRRIVAIQKLRRVARLTRSTEFLLSLKIVNA